jgi:adenosylhomocysteine nucleosidase
VKPNSELGTRNSELGTPKPELILVCFALPEEAAPFRRLASGHRGIDILVTGVGGKNAGRSLLAALAEQRPGLVVTSGFAGGLDPALAAGQVVFACEGPARWREALLAAGARAVRFHCAERIVTTAEEKRHLCAATGADAVEMESGPISALCQTRDIPCATVRVISDTAQEDLPLDFNNLMTQNQELDRARLAATILKSPTRIPALLRLRRQTQAAAQALAKVLEKVLIRP